MKKIRIERIGEAEGLISVDRKYWQRYGSGPALKRAIIKSATARITEKVIRTIDETPFEPGDTLRVTYDLEFEDYADRL